MLPEVLSNDLCSLNPNEDKLAFSAVFEVDSKGTVSKRWFGKTVINSDKRFSYEEAQGVLDAKSGKYFKELDILNKIAKIFQAKKFAEGAIDFETEEVRFKLDENGKPISVYKKPRLDTHKLVEEYMLLANREVAERIGKKSGEEQLFIYRVHDVPNPEKLADLSIFVRALGFTMPHGSTATAKDITKLLSQVEGKSQESLIKTAAIRSMAKAVYSTRNIGHFGLAFHHYTHFTSPIRRYADLLVHRLLQTYLMGKSPSQYELQNYSRIADGLTEKEIAAADAERSSIKYKQVEYMSDKIGNVYDGVITGVTEWGVYVEEVETKSEGMVSVREMTDDYYELREKEYALVGRKSKKRFALGDKVKVKVAKTDLDRKIIDYQFV
jgi:ribonuclease R